MGSFSRSWNLISQSFAVLRSDKQLIVFPILSGFSALLVAAAYFVPLLVSGFLGRLAESHQVDPLVYVWSFLWFCSNYFVIVFFNCALAACAQIRFSGGEPTLSAGIGQAVRKLPRIIVWALVAGTVGTVLRIIEDRSEWLGKIVSAVLGTIWAIATYLMVPVLVFEDLGVFSSIKRSTELLRKTWGPQLVSGCGFGLPFLLLAIPGAALGFAGIEVHPAFLALALLYFLALGALMSAVRGIFAVALYRFATEGEAQAGFSKVVLNGAFVDLSKRRT